MEDGEFVGRDAELRELLACLPTDGQGRLVGLVGAHGIGKKSLLQRFGQVAAEQQGVRVLLGEEGHTVRDWGAGPAWSGLYGRHATPQSARELLDRSGRFLNLLTEDIDPAGFPRFAKVLTDARKALNGPSADASSDAAERAGPDSGRRLRLAQLQAEVDDAFVTDWAGRFQRLVLLPLVGFDALVDDPVGHWFARLAPRLSNTLTVVPLLPGPGATDILDRADRVIRLSPFTANDVSTYLTLPSQFGDRLKPGVSREVQVFTAGHPFAVKLTSDALRRHFGAETPDAGQARQLLASLPRDEAKRFERVLVRVDGGLYEAVEAASAVQSFDEGLLAKLLGGTGSEAAEDLIEQMSILGLLDPGNDGSRRLHDFVRAVIQPALRRKDRWRQLNAIAIDHYLARIEEIEERCASGTYGRWLKYEHTEWQAAKSEWLHHTTEIASGRADIRADFAEAFLEAFFWWGCYIDFPFCVRLLDELELIARDDDDRYLLSNLRILLKEYPTGYRKPPGEHWNNVRRALRHVRDLCGLTNWARLRRPPSAGDNPARVRVYGLIQTFTAHSHRYGGTPDKAADPYRQAIAAYSHVDDGWTVAWLRFEWAELCAERGLVAESGRHAREAATTLLALAKPTDGQEGELDEELIANLHRLLGDIEWPSNPAQSGLEYGLAVVHAYLSQSWPNPLQENISPPDPYTQMFYAEITERAAARILAARADPAVDTAAFVAAMTSPFDDAFEGQLPAGFAPDGTTLADGSNATPAAVAVAASLFPPGPTDEDLLQNPSVFLDAFDDLKEDLTVQLDSLDDLQQLARAFDALARDGEELHDRERGGGHASVLTAQPRPGRDARALPPISYPADAPVAFVSYVHQSNLRGLLGKILDDLRVSVGVLAGVPEERALFDDRMIDVGQHWSPRLAEALAFCRVFIPIYSPGYPDSDYCGQEWTAFARRRRAGTDATSSGPSAIVPMLLTPEAGLRWLGRPPFSGIHYIVNGEEHQSYRGNGLFGLSQRGDTEYRPVLNYLAQRVADAYAGGTGGPPPGDPSTDLSTLPAWEDG